MDYTYAIYEHVANPIMSGAKKGLGETMKKSSQ